MKKPFQVGDRVAVYGLDGNCELVRIKTTITGLPANGQLYLDEKDTVKTTVPRYDFSMAHPKQCRRLVKKPRRRVWVNQYTEGVYGSAYAEQGAAENAGRNSQGRELVEFVEVRRKS
jgi:hypothetical protein